jgi:glycosyltransferase involved in cell wall biosynthesis
LRRGKWDLGYWRSYDYKNDPDYCFVKKADFITAPSMQMKNWAVEKWKIDDKRIKVLENPFLENEAFKRARNYNEEHTIIFFGRLNVLKGLITATKAMKHILKNNPSWRWIIIGADGTSADGKTSMKQWMENQLKALISQVTFHDTVAYEEIPFYLRKASIVLIPSLFESYSYVTIESMSAAKAIVGSKNTGIASLIENNVTGILVDANKSDKWINKIQELINNIALRKSIGKAAFAYVEKKHSVNAEIVGYYKEEIISNTLKY